MNGKRFDPRPVMIAGWFTLLAIPFVIFGCENTQASQPAEFTAGGIQGVGGTAVRVLKDNKTGCEYLITTTRAAITPRYESNYNTLEDGDITVRGCR